MLQTIALALTRDLEKSGSANSIYPSNGDGSGGNRFSKGEYHIDDILRDLKIAVVDMAA